MGSLRRFAAASVAAGLVGVVVMVSWPRSIASVERGPCGGFILDTGETTWGKWGDRRLVGILDYMPATGLGEIDGEVRGDTFHGADGFEVAVAWEPHDGFDCVIDENPPEATTR